MNYRDEVPDQFTSIATSILITDLIAYSTYFVQVAAFTVAEGPYSDSVYVATPEAGVCVCVCLRVCVIWKDIHSCILSLYGHIKEP